MTNSPISIPTFKSRTQGKIRWSILQTYFRESFYNAGTLRDITEFVDPQSVQINKALPYREIEFKYKGTETTLAKQHFESQGVDSINGALCDPM